MADAKANKTEIPRSLIPINGLAPNYQNQILKQAEVQKLRKGKTVFKQGDTDNYSVYLLEGEIELFNNGRLTKTVVGGTPASNNALAQLRPRQFTAKAKTEITIARIDRALLDRFLALDASDQDSAEITVSDLSAEDDADWMTRMLQSDLFARIPTANIQRLFATLEPVEFGPGDVVIEQGGAGDYYFIIQEGHAEVVRHGSEPDKEIKLAELKAGDSFGEEALVSDARRNATVRMLTAGQLMRMTKEDFVELIRKPILRSVSYERGQELVAEGAKWIDVRFADEYAEAGGIPGSENIPLNTIRARNEKLDPAGSYVVYCDTGSRSSVAAFLLSERGFDVSYLEGGFSVVGGRESAPQRTEEPAEPPSAAAREASEAASAASRAEHDVGIDADVSIDAEVRASALKAELAKANLQLKEAIELKSEADEAKQFAEQEARQKFEEERKRLDAEAKAEMQEARELKARLEEAKAEIETRLAARKEALDQKAEQAAGVLRQALELKRRIETAQQEAEREARAKREEEERRIAEIKRQAETRLKDEKSKLEGMYAQIAEELERIQKIRSEAEAKLHEDRARLEKDSVASKQRLEEAKRIEARVQEEATRLAQEQEKAETDLRAEMKTKIDEERRRLEMEFARNAEELERTKRQSLAAEAARQAAAAEAESVISEFKANYARMREQESRQLAEQRRKLLREAKKLQTTVEQARRIKDEALKSQQLAQLELQKLRAAQSAQPADGKLKDRLQSLEAEAAQASERFQQAERAQQAAEAAFSEHQKGIEMADSAASFLQKRVEEDVKEWLAEQEAWELSTVQQVEKAKQMQLMDRIKARAEQARLDLRRHDQALLDEVKQQLDTS